jgi:hypothetical protein
VQIKKTTECKALYRSLFLRFSCGHGVFRLYFCNNAKTKTVLLVLRKKGIAEIQPDGIAEFSPTALLKFQPHGM